MQLGGRHVGATAFEVGEREALQRQGTEHARPADEADTHPDAARLPPMNEPMVPAPITRMSSAASSLPMG